MNPVGRSLCRRLGAVRRGRGHGSAAEPWLTHGLVEETTRVLIVGWVTIRAGAGPVKVTLLVDDTEIATAWAVNASARCAFGDVGEFRFKVRGLWAYLARSQRISVRVDGSLLPILGHGMYLRPRKNGQWTLDDLMARQEQGWVFSQTGAFQLSRKLDTAWQHEVLGLYAGVRAVLAESFGYDAFVIYGSLLGLAREGGFIGHDLDFDSAYISRHCDPAAAGAEFGQIALRLIEAGFDVHCKHIALHIHAAADPAIRIDLFHLFFDSAGVLSFPFGVAGVDDITEQDWRGVVEVPLGPARVLAPVNSAEMAAAIYGRGWSEPNPGFSWARDRRTRALGAHVKERGIAEIARANDLRHGRAPTI